MRNSKTCEVLCRKLIAIASESLGVDFQVEDSPGSTETKPVPLRRSSGASVVAETVSNESTLKVIFHITSEIVSDSIGCLMQVQESPWIQRLINTTCQLLNKELELSQSSNFLEEYSAQISRDFEELVWTRDLTAYVQQSAIRSPLTGLVRELFPNLLTTIQASQIVVTQYDQPIPHSAAIPPIEAADVQSVGEQVVTSQCVQDLINEFGDQARQRIVVNNHFRKHSDQDLSSFILLPIHNHDNEFGWILAANRSCDSFNVDASHAPSADKFHQAEFGTFEAGILQSTSIVLATHAKNTHLHVEQENLLIGIVRALISAVDAKDHATRGHSDRVARISRRLAQELQFDERQCEQVYLAGLLHDIGKIGISDQVLLKRGSLTDEEYEQLKQHPVIGYEMLEHLVQISYVLPGVLYHHEAYDGGGYPAGLQGEEIPLIGRIIAVADAFDAMTSDRPYRKGMPVKMAEEILRTNQGPQWDTNVVNAFFAASDDIHEICFPEVQDDLQTQPHSPAADLISYAVGLTH